MLTPIRKPTLTRGRSPIIYIKDVVITRSRESSVLYGDNMSTLQRTLRVVTYNVRRFTAKDGSSTASVIAAALAQLQPSVVCLNEVDISQPDVLSTVAQHIGNATGEGPAYVDFFGHVRGKYGNAVVSRFPIVKSQHHHLAGGTEALPKPKLVDRHPFLPTSVIPLPHGPV